MFSTSQCKGQWDPDLCTLPDLKRTEHRCDMAKSDKFCSQIRFFHQSVTVRGKNMQMVVIEWEYRITTKLVSCFLALSCVWLRVLAAPTAFLSSTVKLVTTPVSLFCPLTPARHGICVWSGFQKHSQALRLPSALYLQGSQSEHRDY